MQEMGKMGKGASRIEGQKLLKAHKFKVPVLTWQRKYSIEGREEKGTVGRRDSPRVAAMNWYMAEGHFRQQLYKLLLVAWRSTQG